jgi:hypothetical protein
MDTKHVMTNLNLVMEPTTREKSKPFMFSQIILQASVHITIHDPINVTNLQYQFRVTMEVQKYNR